MSVPPGRTDVAQVAVVVTRVKDAHPVFALQDTFPVGFTPPAIVAVNVTSVPKVDGLSDDETVTVGTAWFTV